MASDGADTGRSLTFIQSSMPNTFAFKIQDKRGRMHRFTCGMKFFLFIAINDLVRMVFHFVQDTHVVVPLNPLLYLINDVDLD